MSDWKFSEIFEISIVIFSFLSPVLIALIIIYLFGIAFNEILKINSASVAGSPLLIVLYIFCIVLLGYLEFKLLIWLKKE